MNAAPEKMDRDPSVPPLPPVPLDSSARTETTIAVVAVVLISVHLVLRFGLGATGIAAELPLWAVLLFGGVPLLADLLKKLLRREFGSDLLAGISIVTSVLLGEYLAGSLVVLMLSGGAALEALAVRRASSVLHTLSARMPQVAHRRRGVRLEDIALDDVQVGDELLVLPHEICPVDGTVLEGHGVLDESYLTGEPYSMSKTPGSAVISGSINGDSALTIRADKLAVDSRYAEVLKVLETSAQHRPSMRRLADRLGAWYTPLALAIALGAWIVSGSAVRFLAVLVVATPCPLLIAIPVAIIGSISLAARRAIIIRDPGSLEAADDCHTIVFDKTGTLTYGKPRLVEQIVEDPSRAEEILSLVSSLERFSKHPLAQAILQAATETSIAVHAVSEVSEPPGRGLSGRVSGRTVEVTSRAKISARHPEIAERLPPLAGGLECVVLVDGEYVGTYRFRDEPRVGGESFVGHLSPLHGISRVLLVSGDRESEVRFLAERVGIEELRFDQSPEEKLAIVEAEVARSKTLFVGDGINDAPALMAATVGVAFGPNSDVTMEAADVVVLDSSLEKIDEVLHISRRMRRIALQSAVGGILLSVVGMAFAAAGYLPPVAGALLQELIDIAAVLNALRAAFTPKVLADFETTPDSEKSSRVPTKDGPGPRRR